MIAVRYRFAGCGRSELRGLGVVVRPQVSAATTLLVVAGALVLANLIALVPARAAGRTRPAEVLGTE